MKPAVKYLMFGLGVVVAIAGAAYMFSMYIISNFDYEYKDVRLKGGFTKQKVGDLIRNGGSIDLDLVFLIKNKTFLTFAARGISVVATHNGKVFAETTWDPTERLSFPAKMETSLPIPMRISVNKETLPSLIGLALDYEAFLSAATYSVVIKTQLFDLRFKV